MSGSNPITDMKYDRLEVVGPCHWIVFRVTLGEPQDGNDVSPYQAGTYEWRVPAAGLPLVWDATSGAIRGGTDPMFKKVD